MMAVASSDLSGVSISTHGPIRRPKLMPTFQAGNTYHSDPCASFKSAT